MLLFNQHDILLSSCTYVVTILSYGGLLMQIGERIKKIREFRDITQKDLGVDLGFPANSAAVRIAQYENGSRIPKKETAIAISQKLRCNYINFYDGSDLGEAERIMMDFFWLEESVSGSIYIFQLQKYNDKMDNRVAHGMYNDHQYGGVYPPVAIALNYNMVNDFMREWAIRFQELTDKAITADEYFEWKINWPSTCDDGGRFEPSINWRNASN